MRPISSLLAVAALTAGLIVACGGGLGSPTDGMLGSDPLPNSGDPAHSSTDPPGTGTDPTGGGSCVCPVGSWDCGQLEVDVSLKNGVCLAGKTTIDLCTGKFFSKDGNGTIKPKGNGIEVCLGNQCFTCKAGVPTQTDASVKDTGLPDIGVKDTSVPDAPKDVTKVCVSSCSANSDCQSTCPSAGTGNINCCDTAGSFTCYVNPSSATCP